MAEERSGVDPGFPGLYARTRRFTLGYPGRVQVTPDGAAVLFLRGPAEDPTLRLYEFDVTTGETRELLTPAAALGGAEEQLSVEERARRERLRVTSRGFTEFDLSADGRQVLLPLSGRLFVYHRSGEAAGQVRRLDVGPAPALDPHFSPDGSRVAYVQDHDLHVIEVDSGRAWPVTSGGTELVTHGLAEFVAQEEMHRHRGFWWSPDGRYLAYEEADNRPLERFTIADAAHPERPAQVFPYPRAGQANAIVRLGIVPVEGGETTWARWDGGRYPYLARVLWSERAPLTVLVQTRDQRETALLAVDPATGETRTLHVERDDAWVELDPDLPRWLPDGSGFLMASERSGRRVLELRGPEGELRRALDTGPGEFHRLVHVAPDSRSLGVLSATPITTTLWRVPLDGDPPIQLTRDAAEYAASFARNGAAYVLTRTTLDSPPESAVYRADGARVGVLPSSAAPFPFTPNVELTTVEGASGRSYHAAVIRPRAFEPGRRYPVIVSVYGGPTALTVQSNQRAYLLHQWFADHGAIVVSIDNRGTPRRGRAWSRAIKGSFGRIPLEDQVDALAALGARYAELDLERVGIYGWSFGGFMSALAVLKRPDVFKAAVAGAAVVFRYDYDTHYTERYLDLPDRNPAGYEESSLLTYAGRLERPLLLVHGTADDNVYFFHSLKLADALYRAGQAFDFLPLAGVTHQIADPVVMERLYERMADYLMRHLTRDRR